MTLRHHKINYLLSDIPTRLHITVACMQRSTFHLYVGLHDKDNRRYSSRLANGCQMYIIKTIVTVTKDKKSLTSNNVTSSCVTSWIDINVCTALYPPYLDRRTIWIGRRHSFVWRRFLVKFASDSYEQNKTEVWLANDDNIPMIEIGLLFRSSEMRSVCVYTRTYAFHFIY